jgi:type II secretory pathway component PulK
MSPDGQSGDRGSALVFVLWTASLLAAVLLAVTALVQIQLRSARLTQSEFEDQAALRSALDVVAFDVATIGRSHLASLPTDVTLGERTVRVGLAPAHRMLDINMANDEQWATLFRQLGETDEAAARLADEILDWRDSDDRARTRGAEGAEYGARQRDAPQNRDFLSVEELGSVLSVTPRRLACVVPYVTVLGGTPPPAADSGRFAATSSIVGMRVALIATVGRGGGENRSMAALAGFGTRPDVPYEWIAFGEDVLESRPCSGSAA